MKLGLNACSDLVVWQGVRALDRLAELQAIAPDFGAHFWEAETEIDLSVYDEKETELTDVDILEWEIICTAPLLRKAA